MGHYRSEMGYEAEDERRARLHAERLARRIARAEKMIAEKGIAVVLAEIVDAAQPGCGINGYFGY